MNFKNLLGLDNMPVNPLKIALAQLNLYVGDFDFNYDKMLEAINLAKEQYQADIIVFSELCVCGYPPEDLLLRDSLGIRVNLVIQRLSQVKGITLVIGLPLATEKGLQNQAIVLRDGKEVASYAKRFLPNYQVFDEKRYFIPGNNHAVVFDQNGYRLALSICEDIWHQEVVSQAKKQKADIILCLNASPFSTNKQAEREKVVKQRNKESGLPIVYVNQVGGQDELVFDGGSFVINTDGSPALRLKTHEQSIGIAVFDQSKFIQANCEPIPDQLPSIYETLVLGLQDYVSKNGFQRVVLGLSGGIDSALTLAIAADALGGDQVDAVMMPFRYTSNMSQEDAKLQAKWLSVNYHIIGIEPMFNSFVEQLESVLDNTKKSVTEENLQSRCRGVLLMAFSNQHNALVLSTGNKSEMAVGYATLYGDMVGGFNLLKDISKTLVYRLAKYRNNLSAAIPERVIQREPSAELAPGQQDTDSLPPYDQLDSILALYIEHDLSAETIIAKGFNRETVYRILTLVDRNEFKRRQATTGVRITTRGFGRDRRYPVTNGWRLGN